MELDQPAADGDEASAAAAAATAAQAKSAAAKSLLEGQLLQDVVSLHQQLFSALAVHRLQHQLATLPASAAGSAALAASNEQQQQLAVDDAAREKAFKMCFSLGQQLVAAQQGLLPAAVDKLALPGSIMALALQHRALNTSAAATAAAAAGQQQQQQQLDMQQPFPEEAFLMQQPLSDMSRRLIQLLEEWPEHPLLLQLLAIVQRLLGLPLTVPLKQALTGLELLLARAQVWEETAAKHVSLKQQLAAVAGLATRWRKLELASWKGLLERVRARHAAGASRSWYHLYQVLVLGTPEDAAAAAADAAVADGEDVAVAVPDSVYRRTASLVEAFLQTSTVGEYAARLQLLQSFACQLTVTAAAIDSTTGSSSSSGQVASMLWNVLSYYTQFLPAVSAAIDAGLGPLSKELTDFVKLAKWEDRGYYAMKVSTEKAQRQLHRLSRRAEDYLKQPAAGVLAAASQAMGLGQVTAPKAALAAAAAAGRAAGKAAKAAAAAAAGEAASADAAAGGAAVEATADQQQQQQQKERDAIAAAAAAAAEVDPALLAELDASDLAHATAAAAGSADAFSSSLDSFAAAALAAGGWQAAGVAAIAAAAASGKHGRGKRGRKAAAAAAAAGQVDVLTAPLLEALQQLQPQEQPAWAAFSAATLQASHSSSSAVDLPASSSSYAGRLPKLAARMALVLAPPALPTAVAAAPAAAAEGGSAISTQQQLQQQQQQFEEQLVLALPALQLDDLAATAASRALALSTDTTKGARLRKKKALTDLLHAIGDAGFSKRASDVPAGDRDAAAWFSQSQPCLASSSLLQPLLSQQQQQQQQQQLGSAGTAAGTGAGAVDGALLQLAGVCWGKADSYYFKSLARLQRLQAAAKAPHADLARHEVLAVVGYSQHQLHLVRQQRLLLGDVAGSYTQLLQAVAWLQETAGGYSSSSDAAVLLLPPQEAASSMLSAARQQLCSLSYQLAGARQLVAAVIPMQQGSGQPQHVWKASATAAGKLSSYLAAVDRHRSAVDSEWARISLAGCPVVSHAALAVATAAFEELKELQRDAEAATAAIAAAAAAAGDDAASSSSCSRAVVCRLVPSWDRVLDALAAAAEQAMALQQQAQQATMQQQGSGLGDMQQCQQQFSSCLDEVVGQVLLAAQALHRSSSSGTQQQQAAAADADQQGPAGDTAAAAGTPAVGAAAWQDVLKPARLSGLAASVRTLLSLIAQASNASHASPDSAAAAAAAMVPQAAGLLQLLQLLLGGLQRSACQLLLLHKSLAKLSYVCSSIFCSLVCEGYCMPEGQEGEAQEGTGEGQLQWQDAGGTGMGEGTGKKDVSDQIQNEDQLLGAQQKDQQQQQEEPPQQQGDEDDAQGVEMNGDFDGALHDIDDRRQQQQGDDDDEEEEGDDDRIDQQMGEVRRA
jgi:midasin